MVEMMKPPTNMSCISASSGTFFFAILNIMLVSLSTISFTGLTIVVCWTLFHTSPSQGYEMGQLILHGTITLILLTYSLVNLLFSSFLLHGVLNKKSAHVKAYYVFGIVHIISTVIFTSIVMEPELWIIAICLIIWTTYSLILYMIRCTYLQYEVENDFHHKPLVEKC